VISMPERLIDKLAGRCIEAAWCEQCKMFMLVTMPVNGVGTPVNCPACTTPRIRVQMAIEHVEE
jgi:hypothetical protein